MGNDKRVNLEDVVDRVVSLERRLEILAPPEGATGELLAGHECRVPSTPPRNFDAPVSQHRARLIAYSDKKWVNFTTLRYYFFRDGHFAPRDEAQLDLVRTGFKAWSDLGIGIKFVEESDISEAEIRIGFLDGDGAWSYVGRDCLKFPGQAERTMNFGWDLTRDPRREHVATHEIGHALGFPHAHQTPFAGIEWDEDAVLAYFSGPPNNWEPSDIQHNVLRKLPAGEVEGTNWDPDSIMHYSFPPGLVLRPDRYRTAGIRPAGGLSPTDIGQVRRFYPSNEREPHGKLKPCKSHKLMLKPAEQVNLDLDVHATREYTIRTFGASDTVIVLFEEHGGQLRYIAGDDDSGTALNAEIVTRLIRGRRYVLRLRLYFQHADGELAVMYW